MIPKIIHYCWISNDPVPQQFEEYITGWKNKLKEYDFVKWDFSKFDKSSSVWVSEAFNSKKYAFAADYIRLYAIYNYGGIYLDMDIEVIKAFDELLDREYMMAVERPNEPWIEAGCFGAEKGNYFIGKCLEYYKGKHFILSDGSFDQLPLPKVMEKVRNINGLNLNLYPWYYFTAKSYHTGIETPTKDTFCIHHFAGSWKTKEEREDFEVSKKYCKVFGNKLGYNIAEYLGAGKRYGIKGIYALTLKKIRRKTKMINK